MNENYLHPDRPASATKNAIMSGCYKFLNCKNPSVRILASGVTLRFALDAAKILKQMNIDAELWSITSFNELARGGLESERSELFNQKDEPSYVEKCFMEDMPTVAVSEYMRSYANQIRKYVNGKYICLGTDGFGRSDTREKLREYFEINENYIVYSSLIAMDCLDLAKQYAIDSGMKKAKEHPWKK